VLDGQVWRREIRTGFDGETRRKGRGLMVKPEGKGPLGKPRCKWQDNIKMNVSNGDVRKWTGLII